MEDRGMAELKCVKDYPYTFTLHEGGSLVVSCVGKICALTPRLIQKAKEALGLPEHWMPGMPIPADQVYQVISYIEIGIKNIVLVPHECDDTFRQAAIEGNQKARERIFGLEWQNKDLIDAENLISTLVDPPSEGPESDERWDYERSQLFFDETGDVLDFENKEVAYRGPIVAMVDQTGDWALIKQDRVILTGGAVHANCGWPASLEDLMEVFPGLQHISIESQDLPKDWSWQTEILPRLDTLKTESKPKMAI
jgi:hypothetical protein